MANRFKSYSDSYLNRRSETAKREEYKALRNKAMRRSRSIQKAVISGKITGESAQNALNRTIPFAESPSKISGSDLNQALRSVKSFLDADDITTLKGIKRNEKAFFQGLQEVFGEDFDQSQIEDAMQFLALIKNLNPEQTERVLFKYQHMQELYEKLQREKLTMKKKARIRSLFDQYLRANKSIKKTPPLPPDPWKMNRFNQAMSGKAFKQRVKFPNFGSGGNSKVGGRRGKFGRRR